MRGPTRVISKMLEGLGATPVGMPVPKVAPSLSKGVIDGMVVPWEIMPSFKLHELTKAHTEVSGDRGVYTTPFLFLMNKAKYGSLSDDLKKVISMTDVLIINDEEALQLSNKSSISDASSIILEMGPRFLIIKRGESGATLFKKNNQFNGKSKRS